MTGAGVENAYLYDAFGSEVKALEQRENRIRYTGQQYDGVTEQYYLRARYYNPVLGRFLQEDVYQGDGLNLYAYCGNNPVMYWDPSGYAKKPGSGCPPNAKINEDGGRTGESAGEGSRGIPEAYYRTMSPEDYDKLRMTGELQPTGETFIVVIK